MNTLTIKTNNHPRPFLHSWDLTEKQRKEVDATDDDERSFVGYKGHVYSLDEFTTTKPGPWNHGLPEEFKKWDGYLSDSFFSGILIRFDEEHENAILATYFS